jgi:ornithine cyclodeaminase/alanine dehydrogenase-like protein (mu-crystallin family)
MDLEKLLRLQKEPCIFVSDVEEHNLLMEHREDYFRHFDEGFRFWAAHPDRVMITPKQIYTSPGIKGDFRVMPCQIHSDAGSINTVKLVGTDEEERVVKDKISVGKAFIFHPTDNFIMGVFDACILSSVRTGACAAMGFKYLGGDAKRVGIIGCGRVGYYSAEFISLFPSVETFVCYDTNPMNLECFKELVSARGLKCEYPKTLDEVKQSCDALILSTYSPVSLVSGADLKSGRIRFISSSGADADNLSEMDPTVPEVISKIYVDTEHSLKVADLKRWKTQGLIKVEDVIELKEIVGGRHTPDMKQIRLFVTTGFAFLDCLTMDYMYRTVTEKSERAGLVKQ